MRYSHPQITGTFKATSTIESMKGMPPIDTGTNLLSSGAAYQADE